jgi:hypothetical protein
MAQSLARKILGQTVLVVLDDQNVKYDLGGASSTSGSETWRKIFPMAGDRSALTRSPNPRQAFRWDAQHYFKEHDKATFILGGADF